MKKTWFFSIYSHYFVDIIPVYSSYFKKITPENDNIATFHCFIYKNLISKSRQKGALMKFYTFKVRSGCYLGVDKLFVFCW